MRVYTAVTLREIVDFVNKYQITKDNIVSLVKDKEQWSLVFFE